MSTRRKIKRTSSHHSESPKRMLTPEKKSMQNHQHNLRSLSTQKLPQRTLNIKNKATRANVPRMNFNDSKENEKDQQIVCHFSTERINLPRGKVVRSSRSSSARNSQSPLKVPRALANQEPNFNNREDYFKEYWKLYLQNESLIADIETTSYSNYKMSKKIYNLEDYYEHHLIPQLLTYPHKFVHRLRQQQHQRQLQQQKIQQAKQQASNEQSQTSNQQNSQQSEKTHKRKKHLRRTAAEIERDFVCPYQECGKFYGSEGSLNLHIKIKHNGGNKTEREKLAKTLVQAFLNGNINKELDSLDLNLPPGTLQKAVKKVGLGQQVSEGDILKQITQQIQISTGINLLKPHQQPSE